MSEPGQPRGGPSDRHRPQQAAPAPHPSTPSGVLRHDQLPSRSRSDGRPGEQGSGRDATTAASGGRFHGPSGGPGPTRRNILGGGQNCPATSGGRFLGPLAGQAPMGTAQGGRLPPAARGGRLPDPLGEQGLVTGLQSQEEARLATSGGRLRDASGGQRSLQSGQRSRGRQHGQDVLGAGAGTTSTGGSSLGRVGYGGPPGQGYHPLPQQLTSGHGGLGGRAGEHGSQGMNPGSSGSGFYQGPPRQQQQSDFRPAAQGQHQSLAPAGFFFDNHGNLWPLSAYEQYMPAAFPPPVDIRSMDPPPPPRVPPPHQSTNRRARREPPSLHDRHDRSGNPLPPRKDSNSSKESVESGRVEKLGKDKGGKPRKKVRALGGYTRGTGQQTPLAGNLRARLEAEAERAQAVTLQQQQRQFGVARRAQEAERRRRESGFGNLVYEPEIDPRYQMVPWEGQLPIPVDMRTYWSWNQRPAQSNDFDFGFDFRPAPIFDMGTNSWLPPLQLLPQHHQHGTGKVATTASSTTEDAREAHRATGAGRRRRSAPSTSLRIRRIWGDGGAGEMGMIGRVLEDMEAEIDSLVGLGLGLGLEDLEGWAGEVVSGYRVVWEGRSGSWRRGRMEEEVDDGSWAWGRR
ncbi:MAG: hypothetical protein MMC23_000165 [Stictis urceolatum]|nr:hypothetical protein [Stictis urceolata]